MSLRPTPAWPHSLAKAEAIVRSRLARGERFKIAWRATQASGILRRHDEAYFSRRWTTRHWWFFAGETPDVIDVSEQIAELQAALLPQPGELEAALAERLSRTRVVFRDGRVIAEQYEALHRISWHDRELAIGPRPESGIDLTGSLVADQVDGIDGVTTYVWPPVSHPMQLPIELLVTKLHLQEELRRMVLPDGRRLSLEECDRIREIWLTLGPIYQECAEIRAKMQAAP